MKVLVTGAAGFIGFYTVKKLLEANIQVVGLDNLNTYYDPSLKQDRLAQLNNDKNFTFYKAELSNQQVINTIFIEHKISKVIHLAAQAGVRYSLENPHAYVESNILGFLNILEACRQHNVEHLIYASSSSVYGSNIKIPFSVKDSVDHPVSLYAATKKSNELMAHTYSNLYQLPTTGLRFFTVYGPWGRPDMAYFSFTKKIFQGETIQVFNNGDMMRDFTYIQDIVNGITQVIDRVPKSNSDWDRHNPDPSSSYAPYKIYNIGNHQPINLLRFITILEELIGKKAKLEFLPMQPGDVQSTYADIDDIQSDTGFKPTTSIESGLFEFVDWYKRYYLSGGSDGLS